MKLKYAQTTKKQTNQSLKYTSEYCVWSMMVKRMEDDCFRNEILYKILGGWFTFIKCLGGFSPPPQYLVKIAPYRTLLERHSSATTNARPMSVGDINLLSPATSGWFICSIHNEERPSLGTQTANIIEDNFRPGANEYWQHTPPLLAFILLKGKLTMMN